ncbi:unnamed protein product [Phaeothamnion confervicola]
MAGVIKLAKVTRYQMALGAAYMLAMGVCGIVLVALGSTLEDLAENCGKTSTQVGSVFVARGVGAVLGAVSSAKLYRWFGGNNVMTASLSALTSWLLYMPFITNVPMLHVAFFGLGLCTAITDTGCQIMTRKVHGIGAGPWLGANTVAFGISGALVPLLAYLTGSLFVQYAILATVGLIVAMFLLVLPPPESQPGFARGPPLKKAPAHTSGPADLSEGFVRRYRVEFTVGAMVFWLIGGKVGITAYLTQYVEDTGVIRAANASLLIMVLWSAITVGRLAGIQDQRTLTLPKLYSHATGLLGIGAFGMFTVLAFPDSSFVLWAGVALYGLFNGPTVGYCYDLNNRTTHPTETGMSIVMFGLNFGASVIPYLLSWLWETFDWPQVLIITVFLSHVVPYPLMLTVKRMHENMTSVHI